MFNILLPFHWNFFDTLFTLISIMILIDVYSIRVEICVADHEFCSKCRINKPRLLFRVRRKHALALLNHISTWNMLLREALFKPSINSIILSILTKTSKESI